MDTYNFTPLSSSDNCSPSTSNSNEGDKKILQLTSSENTVGIDGIATTPNFRLDISNSSNPPQTNKESQTEIEVTKSTTDYPLGPCPIEKFLNESFSSSSSKSAPSSSLSTPPSTRTPCVSDHISNDANSSNLSPPVSIIRSSSPSSPPSEEDLVIDFNNIPFPANTFICPYCIKHYTSYQAMKKHANTTHKDCNPGWLFKCTVCNTIVKTKRKLSAHQKSHSSEDLLKAKNTSTVDLHNILKFVCKYCFSKFPNKHSLGNHVRYHHPLLEQEYRNSEHLTTHTFNSSHTEKVGKNPPSSSLNCSLNPALSLHDSNPPIPSQQASHVTISEGTPHSNSNCVSITANTDKTSSLASKYDINETHSITVENYPKSIDTSKSCIT